MQNSLYKLFEHKCVLEVCPHIHPIMIKIPPVFFFKIPILKSPFSNQVVLRFLSEWRSSAQATPTKVDWQDRLTLSYLRPGLSELRAVNCPTDSGAGEDKMSPFEQLRCFVVDVVMNIAVVIYSQHLSRWRCRGLTLLSFWRECANPDLPKCVYVCANHSWSSFIYRSSEYKIVFFYESLQIAFPNNVLVSQFWGYSKQYACHPMEERGGVSRAH